ncbi:MAG TPA: energy transducer TonB [Candidatus Cloacimonadota bacterium]|nr:energy transducer TonB [Candidatus Cloacimonadota bacterium]
MTTNKLIDWKDIANSQFSKAVALAAAIVLFGLLVAPRMETSSKETQTVAAEMIDAPTDTREKEEAPKESEVNIEIPMISEELATEDTPELKQQRALALQQFGDLQQTTTSTLQSSDSERPFDFVPWDDPPVPIGAIKPEYPDFARRARVQGTVMLEVDVYKDGSTGNIKVVRSVQSGPGGLDEAAINAVKRIRFQPGKSSGNPIDTRVILPVEFKLN